MHQLHSSRLELQPSLILFLAFFSFSGHSPHPPTEPSPSPPLLRLQYLLVFQKARERFSQAALTKAAQERRAHKDPNITKICMEPPELCTNTDSVFLTFSSDEIRPSPQTRTAAAAKLASLFAFFPHLQIRDDLRAARIINRD